MTGKGAMGAPERAAGHMPHGAPPEGDAGPRRALILAGGGMRVAYQAGVLRALFEEGLRFAHADGTSGGTINLAMLLSGLSPAEMGERWRTLNVKDFVTYLPWQEYLTAHDLPAIGDPAGLRNKVFPHLGVDFGKIRGARGMEGTFNVCNFTRKTNEVIGHDRMDLDLLVAAISLPIFLPPVPRDGALYLDSAWIKDANLMEAVRRGAEELWVVWCIGNTGAYKNGFFHQYVHMLEISANGGLFEEFDRINEINERIARGETVYGHTNPIRLHLIRPECPLPLDPEFFFGRIDAATLIALGYGDAKSYLAHRTEKGLSFSPEVTKMQENELGLTFRETMAGPFAMGETDPEAGAKKGAADGTTLSMHAAVDIRGLERFVAEPGHAGTLTGTVDFPPLGQGMPASVGVFNLFSPADTPRRKYMVYELGFEHDGQPYYLAGKKIVENDPGFDLWKDTTTLFTRLHRGTDATGPVVGAGILSLNIAELTKLVSTMRVTNAPSAAERAKALATFGRFFLGELWGSYAAHAGA